jgi:carbonic anhydrase
MVDDVDRRQFLRTSFAGALAGTAGLLLGSARELRASSPDSALEQLLAGNRRFVANPLKYGDLRIRREQTAEEQHPFAAVLSCADSRVPVELIFDQSIGQIFVTRVAGNIVTPEIIASLEYAVAVLGVPVLVVLGHANCGALKAAMKNEDAPGQISALYAHLHPAIAQSSGNIARAIEVNARTQADLLRTSSTVIPRALKAGTLKVAAGVYDLTTGKVAIL